MEWNPSILKKIITCNNMNEPGEHYAKWKAEKDKYFIILLTCRIYNASYTSKGQNGGYQHLGVGQWGDTDQGRMFMRSNAQQWLLASLKRQLCILYS